MKRNILVFLSLVFYFTVPAQNFTGQWKGEFIDKTTSFGSFGGDQCDYVLELECKGKKVTGSSYTYFNDGGKKYYTICKLEGFIDSRQKYIEVRETERTKTNVPVNIRNCFQVHKLTYFKQGDTAILEGNWVPAPNQDGDCGRGTTLLTRRELKQSYPNFNAAAGKTRTGKTPAPTNKKEPTAKTPAEKLNPPVVKNNTPPKNKNTDKSKNKNTEHTQAATATTVQPKKNVIPKENLVPAETPANQDRPDSVLMPRAKFEKRNNTVLKTITVKNKCVKVDLYDNGEIDGDSISLFYNGKLLMSSKRLSEKPISLSINVEDDAVNELVMYAENLGTIPPNTALMVVTDGPKRYEVRITSDLQKSGVINFIHRQDSDK